MRKIILQLKKRKVKFFLILFLLINGGSLLYFLFNNSFSIKTQPTQAISIEPEIKGIVETADDKRRVSLYTQLIERVGPLQAQEALYNSGLPFDGQAHLLNHTVGDWIYKKYNTAGLVHCKDYFLSSCYHGFVISLIAESGFDNLNGVMENCWEVNGMTTAAQCAHAIGHGFLGWEGYKNLPKALADCDLVATLSKDFPTYNCYDGVFMENNWAVHIDGKPSPDRWIDMNDPVYPCNDPNIAEKYRKACWSNQPQMMHKDIFHGDLVKVAAECSKLENTIYKETCFDSIARQINPIAQGNPDRVFILCDKMPVGWKNACVLSNVSAFFSVGDREVPFSLCARIPEDATGACYSLLEERIFSYELNLNNRFNLCSQIPKNRQSDRCRNLSLN